jgi:hypothetical protein
VVLVALVVAAFICWRSWSSPEDHADPAPVVRAVVAGSRFTGLLDALAVDDAGVRDCVVAHLDRDPGFVGVLEAGPGSEAPPGVAAAVDGCRSRSVSAGRLRDLFGGRIDDAQVRCLADHLAAFPATDRDRVIDGRVVGVPEGPLRARAVELLALCGLEASSIGGS